MKPDRGEVRGSVATRQTSRPRAAAPNDGSSTQAAAAGRIAGGAAGRMRDRREAPPLCVAEAAAPKAASGSPGARPNVQGALDRLRRTGTGRDCRKPRRPLGISPRSHAVLARHLPTFARRNKQTQVSAGPAGPAGCLMNMHARRADTCEWVHQGSIRK